MAKWFANVLFRFRSDALRNLTGGAIVDENVEFRLTLNVDEARRGEQTCGIRPFGGGSMAEIADRGDAITNNADVCDKPRGAGVVDDAGTREDEIVVRLLRLGETCKEEEVEENQREGKPGFCPV